MPNSAANESEVVLSIALDDQVTPALAGLEAGYTATLSALEAATTAAAGSLAAAWQAPLMGLAQAGQEALGWLSAVGQELAAVGSLVVSPTVTINDLATPALRSIQAQLAALDGGDSGMFTTTTTYSAAAASIDRQTVRSIIVPELERLGLRS